ncbi:MAG: tetraacyldisaccharide 4'-kinase [Gemmatimonadota bacterium]
MSRGGARSVLEPAVHAWWAGKGGAAGAVLSALLLPAGALFAGAVRLRNATYDHGWRASARGAIPVVSIGNLSVGGTGKTPVSAWVAVALRVMGERPAIVSRGYGRDELALHAAWNPGIPVQRAPDRLEGIARAADLGATVAILDDGFQHRRAERDLDVVLLAVEQPFPPRLLPRGPYREPLSSLRRADLLVLTRKIASLEDARMLEQAVRQRHPELGIVRIHLRPSRWKKLGGGAVDAPGAGTVDGRENGVLAVSSIASPDTFHALVREAIGQVSPGTVEGCAFPDHHEYTQVDAERIVRTARGRTVVTTEKDAVKLVEFSDLLPDVRVLGLDLVIESGETRLRGALQAAVRRSRTSGENRSAGSVFAKDPPGASEGGTSEHPV